MITKTFGAGGTYATLKLALASITSPLSDDFDVQQVGNSTDTDSITLDILHFNGYAVTIRSMSPHGGNPNSGYKIALGSTGSITLNNYSYESGSISLVDLNISCSNLTSAAVYFQCPSGSQIISNFVTRVIISTSGTALSNGGSPLIVNSSKICTTSSAVHFDFLLFQFQPNLCVIENCTFTYKVDFSSLIATARNCVSPSFLNTSNALGYNNARIAAAMDDSTWKSGSSGNIGNVVAANEFKSTTITDATWLFLKDDAVGTLATSGTTPVYATTDIAGLAIPQAGNYSIGCHVSYVTPPPEFPDMIIDSGVVYKDYGLETETIIGATRGGNKFWIEQGIEDIGYDGRGANVKGAKKILRVQPFVEVNVVEISQDLLLSALPASVVASGATQVTITRALQISLSDYCDNITIVGEIYGKNLPIICMVKNALCVSDLNMEYIDKAETVLTLKFAGHFDEDNLNEEPWEIRYPRA